MQVEGVHRPAHAEISASAIAHNVRAIKAIIGDSQFCAVVKANGYGHGADLAAKAALEGGADMLAVAIIDEGIEFAKAASARRYCCWPRCHRTPSPPHSRVR